MDVRVLDRERFPDRRPAALKASQAVLGEDEDAEADSRRIAGGDSLEFRGINGLNETRSAERLVSNVVEVVDAVEDPVRFVVAAEPDLRDGDVLRPERPTPRLMAIPQTRREERHVRVVERVLVRMPGRGDVGEAVADLGFALTLRDVVHVDRIVVKERIESQSMLAEDRRAEQL